MMKTQPVKWTGKLIKDDSGMHSVEIAFGIALIAAVAGFGMVVLGDAIADFFADTGEGFNPGATLPEQPTDITSPGSGTS